MVAITERWLLPIEAVKKPSDHKKFFQHTLDHVFVGFSFVLNIGSGRLAHTLTGAEGQATEAAATMAAVLEECAPHIFSGDIFLPLKNCPAGPP